MISQNYNVSLDNFSGPLDLLLQLIENKKLDVCDISLAKVTDDYLEFVRNADLNQHTVNRFLEIAAQLILIKSWALLPENETEKEALFDDDLSTKLQELAKYKKSILKLYFNDSFKEIISKNNNVATQIEKIDMTKLYKIYLQLQNQTKSYSTYRLKRRYDKQLKQKLAAKLVGLKKIKLNNLLNLTANRVESVLVFMLVLEFVKDKKAVISNINGSKHIIFS